MDSHNIFLYVGRPLFRNNMLMVMRTSNYVNQEDRDAQYKFYPDFI